LAAALAISSAASTASAHGGVVRAFQVLNERSNPNTFVIRSDVWGFFYSNDAGQSWKWSCAEPYQSISTAVNHTQMDLVGNGRLIVANAFKGVFYTDTFCDWSQATGLDGELVADVKNAGGNDVMALTSTGGQDGKIKNRLWSSTDKGSSFAPMSSSLPTDVVLSNFAIAPSNPDVIYAMGLVLESTDGVIFRSEDGGKTFARFTAPTPPDATLLSVRIAAIHPTNPDVVFEWIDLPESLGQNSPDALNYTKDGGKSWHKLFTATGDLPGLAISPDGKTLVISGSVDGVYSGKMDDILAADDGSTALTQVNALSAWGLLWNEKGLYGGTDNFSLRGTPQTYTLGLSTDEGKSFDEVVNICQFQYPTCATGTQVRELCDFLWESPAKEAGGFRQDFWVSSGRCPGQVDGGVGSGADAGRGDGGKPAKDDGGCALSAPTSATPSGGLVALGMSAFALTLFRRLRPRRSPPRR
jgi:photosystem II stability/assembly factor-like uncharacterized protein